MALAFTGFRFLLGFVFLLAGAPKLLRPAEFVRTVANYRLMPSSLVGPTARLLPLIELGCSLMLFAGIWVSEVSFVAAGILVVFALAVSINLARGREIECGCSGAGGSEPISWRIVIRDLGFGALASVVAVLTIRNHELGDPKLAAGNILGLLVVASVLTLIEGLSREAFQLRAAVAGLTQTVRLGAEESN